MSDETPIAVLPPPSRLTAEMIIRYYLSQIDQLEDVAVIATFKNKGRPMISVTTDMSEYLLAFAGNVLSHLSMRGVETKKKAP